MRRMRSAKLCPRSRHRWPRFHCLRRTSRRCCGATLEDHGQRPALRFADQIWSHEELLAEAERFSALYRARLDPARPPHVGVLLDNTPDYVFALCGAGLAGVAVAGLNYTRVGEHLGRDIEHTDLQLVITEPRHQAQLGCGDGGSRTARWDPGLRTLQRCRRPDPLGRRRSGSALDTAWAEHRAAATDGARGGANATLMSCGPCCSRPGHRRRPRQCGAPSDGCSPPATACP